jgi:hypothetical protein
VEHKEIEEEKRDVQWEEDEEGREGYAELEGVADAEEGPAVVAGGSVAEIEVAVVMISLTTVRERRWWTEATAWSDSWLLSSYEAASSPSPCPPPWPSAEEAVAGLLGAMAERGLEA